MDCPRITFFPEKPRVFLDFYGKKGIRGRKALLILPGGAYSFLAEDREGAKIAETFLKKDFQPFVLHYSVAGQGCFPDQLVEVAAAICHLKEHSEEYGIDPEGIFLAGFSAGGHLAASAGVLWKHPVIKQALNVPDGQNKPAGMLLLYPVIMPEGHMESFYNLLATKEPTREQLEQVTLHRHVNGDTVPAFLMHTAADRAVPVENALLFGRAMAEAGRPFELHVFPRGGHGIALATEKTSCGVADWEDEDVAKWVELASSFACRVMREKKGQTLG